MSDFASAATFIGMDEAGYGPNLGPLVIAATSWSLPKPPTSFDFYAVLADAVSREGTGDGTLLHVADSKEIHSSARGLAALETSALSLLRLLDVNITTYRSLLRSLCCGEAGPEQDVPWRRDADVPLPVAADLKQIDVLSMRLSAACRRESVYLNAIQVTSLEPCQFNRGLASAANKAQLLTCTALKLLRRQWNPGGAAPTLIVGDKHGGRNFYLDSLTAILDGEMVFTIEEGTEISRYRTGRTELRFQTKGEQHLPVAAASIIAKYLRELSLELFNRYWSQRIPGIRPTKGYPGDAARFRTEILSHTQELGLNEIDWWRVK